MSEFNVDESVIWTSPHTKERVYMSFRGDTGLTFACLYNYKTGMQIIAPLDEIEHDWRVMCGAEELKNAQMTTELAYVMQERNEYLERAAAAEARAAQLQAERDDLATDYAMLRKERDAARYEATMEAARQCYDAAMRAASAETYSRFLSVFHAIAGEYAERKS